MRGIRKGNQEIDLLAIKPVANGQIEARHVEVQVSFRPISYLSKLTDEQMASTGAKSRTSAKTRSSEVISVGIDRWVENKFRSKVKVDLREAIAGGLSWKFEFVHGKLKDENELSFLKGHGIELIPFKRILSELMKVEGWVGGTGTDIAEMIDFHRQD